MLIVLIILLAVSFFELRSLIKAKEKKEAVLYIALAIFAAAVGVFMMLIPDFMSFSRMILKLFDIS